MGNLTNTSGALGVPAGAEAGIYRRVSSPMQIKGFSLPAQKHECEKLAELKGWRIRKIYSDEGASGRTMERDAFQRMLADIEAGKLDVIIVHRLNRLTRSLHDLLQFTQILEKTDTRLISATEMFDFTSPLGKVMLSLLGALAEWDSNNLAEEVKKGQRGRAKAGYWKSKIPYGYTVLRWIDDEGKEQMKAIFEPHEKKVVMQIFEIYSKGIYSYRDVASILNEKGYLTRDGYPWRSDRIHYVLSNIFYIGKVSLNGEVFDGLHDGIVTTELFELCATVRNQRRRMRSELSQKRRDHIYLLKGVAYCARCNSKLGTTSRRNKTIPTTYYFTCPAGIQRKDCTHRFIRMKAIDDEIISLLKSIELPSDWQEQIKANVEKYLETQDQELIDNEKHRSNLKAEANRWRRLFVKGHVGEDEYDREVLEIKLKLEEIPTTPITEQATTAENLAEIIQNIGSLWDVANDKEKRQIAQTLIKSVYVDKEKGITKLEWADELGLIMPKPTYSAS